MSSVPAWKRLGLKLKGPVPAPAPNPQSSPSGPQHSAGGYPHSNGFSSSPLANKRKFGANPDSTQKRARYDPSDNRGSHDYNSVSTPNSKKRKSVSFAPDTKLEATTPSATWTPATTNRQRSLVNGSDSSPAPAKKTKKKKGPPKKLKPSPAPNLETALAYLQTWNTDRENWKFNKNHQTSLLRHIFPPPDPKAPSNSTIPAGDIPILLEYIRDLKGFVRTRLREAAEEIKTADMAPYTSKNTGFPDGAVDVAARQAEYDDLIRTFLTQPTSPSPSKPRYSFSFSESEFHKTYIETNTFVSRRVVKRMRAEMVLDAISSDSDSSETSATSNGTEPRVESRSNDRESADKRLKLNNGTLQRVKRRRKIRTADIDSDSSSDEGGSSSSSSSDSGSESDNDADSESESGSEEEAADNEEDSSDDDDTSSDGDDTASSADEEEDADVDGNEVGQGLTAETGIVDVEPSSSSSSSSSESSSSSDSESDSDVVEGTVKMDVVHAREALETSSSSESSDTGDDSD